MSSFFLKLIATDKVYYQGRVRSVVLPETDGQHEILAHHENLIMAVKGGWVKFQKEGEDTWEEVIVGCGMAQVVNNRVMVLVETAESPEEIDVRRASEAKERAEEQLRQEQSIREYYHTQASLARAMERLKASNKNL